MKLYYLNHSGFAWDDGNRVYIFDYYKDPTGIVDRFAEKGRELWFFVSHWHGDHYVPAILDFDDGETTRYIVHRDVPHEGMPKNRTTVMDVGNVVLLGQVMVTMYGSTDEGGSFLVNNGEYTVFHAGDLNWWHWLGDTDENNRFARNYAVQEFERVRGMQADVVMFPVDARLEAAREWGPIEFLHVAKVKQLFVPMHADGPKWKPSLYFKALYEDMPLWIPDKDGDMTTL